MARFGVHAPSLGRAVRGWLGLAVSVLALQGVCSAAQSAPAADNRIPGLSGFWRLKDKGSVQPQLTASAKAQMAKPDRKGDVDVEGARWCVFQGMPYVMDNAGPLQILQTPADTVIVAERLAIPRHVYFRLKQRPSPDVFDFTPVGNSMGRRVGDALVVDTQMFMDGIGPEGAPRTEKSKLTERFQVSKDGKELAVTSTWTDPGVFTKPYVYTWTYEKLPDDYTVVDYYCDPRANGAGNYPPGDDPRANAPAKK